MLYHLAPKGSISTSGEGEIRKALVEADLIECMVALPGRLFTNTQIPACIWFLTKNKNASGRGKAAFRDRRKEVLFIDARKLGTMADRVLRAFSDDDINKIVSTFHHCKRGTGYEDIAGFCKSAPLACLADHGHVLTPGRYVLVITHSFDG